MDDRDVCGRCERSRAAMPATPPAPAGVPRTTPAAGLWTGGDGRARVPGGTVLPLKRASSIPGTADAARAQGAGQPAAPGAVGSAALAIEAEHPTGDSATASSSRPSPGRVVPLRLSPRDGTPAIGVAVEVKSSDSPPARDRLAAPPDGPRRPVRPPVLASEALREDLVPAEPGKEVMRRVAIAAGVAGAIVAGAAFAVLGPGIVTVVALAAFVAAAAAGAAPLTYDRRAGVVLATGALALIGATAERVLRGAPWGEILIAIAVPVLATGLFFRSAHRASRGARVIVAVGLLLVVSWLVLAGTGVQGAALHGGGWTLWVATALRGALGLLVLISLLAFMHAGTTGGCNAWGAIVLAWLAAHVGILTAHVAIVSGTGLPVGEAASSAIVVLGAVLAAMGAAHLLAGRSAREIRPSLAG